MRKRKNEEMFSSSTEELRKNSIVIFVGDRGTGKTTHAVKLMLKRNYPAIILDRMNQDNYDGITSILHDSSKLENWTRKGRIRVHDKDALDNIIKMLQDSAYDEEKKHLKTITSLIILEDAGNYVASNMRLNLIELCTSCRHSNVDLFFMFHNLADIPPKLYAYCDYIVLFKIKKAESQLKLLDKITNKEETLEAFRSLKKDKEPHANRTVRIQAS